jgi:hypothetical protein
MPSQTSVKNLPFPLGTDRVMDGDDQIRKLAQSVDNMAQGGLANINVTTGGSPSTLVVTFPVAYAAVPVVTTGVQGSSPNIGSGVQAVTATNVTLSGYRATAGTQGVYWIAIGPVVAVA